MKKAHRFHIAPEACLLDLGYLKPQSVRCRDWDEIIYHLPIMTPVPTCPVCGTTLAQGHTGTLCPACLLRAALRPESLPETIAAAPREALGTMIGRYKLLEEIGEGGFGIVYMAEQTEPVKRRVALKVLKPGMDTREIIARFEAERQALALMDHPNIARVHDGGTTDSGRPYFVMELVKGMPITTYCDHAQLTTRERLDLFLDVLAAVQHAHQKGIIHRDLKPSNILVSPHDGRPVIKVIDFGIAKALSMELTSRTLFTGFGQMLGTPQYTSPEQAEVNALDVDTRSDIYSLGVVLYELLTGQTPLDARKLRESGYAEIQRIIREDEPPKPSTRIATLGQSLPDVARHRGAEPLKLAKQVRGDLDWIVMKALEKDRRRRYETANGFAADLRRHLADEPVVACPPSHLYRLRKLMRRHKGGIATATALILTLLSGVAVSIWQAMAAVKARDEESKQRENAVSTSYASQIRLGGSMLQENQIAGLPELLDPWVPEAGGRDRRGWEWYYLNSQARQERFVFKGTGGQLMCVVWHPDGRRFATGGADGRIAIWDVTKAQPLEVHAGHDGLVCRLAWRPNGSELASAGRDGLVKLWTGPSFDSARTLTKRERSVNALSWRPDGGALAIGGEDNSLLTIDPSTGATMRQTATDGMVMDASWNPSGQTLAAGLTLSMPYAVLWNPEEGSAVRQTPLCGGAIVRGVAWAENGSVLLGTSDRQMCGVHWLDNQKCLYPSLHNGPVRAVAASPFFPDLFATAAADGPVVISQPASKEPLLRLYGHQGSVNSLSWHPSAGWLLSGGSDGNLHLWKIDPKQRSGPLRRTAGKVVEQVRWSHDDQRLLASPERLSAGSMAILNSTSLAVDGVVGDYRSFGWSGDWGMGSSRIVTVGDSGVVQIWSATEKRLLFELPLGGVSLYTSWDPEGNTIAVSLRPQMQTFPGSGEVVLIDGQNGRIIRRWHCPGLDRLAWSHDHRLAVTTCDGRLEIWNPATGTKEKVLLSVDEKMETAAWSPDNCRLAATTEGGRLIVVEVASGSVTINRTAHAGLATGLDWSPDGLRIATGASDARLKIHDSVTGVELFSARGYHGNHPVKSVAWSHDGLSLATLGGDGTLVVWSRGRESSFTPGPVTMQEILSHPEPDTSKPRDKTFPARADNTPGRCLDLSEFYNARLDNSMYRQGNGGYTPVSLPAGCRKILKTDFDIRGIVQLQGRELRKKMPEFPAGCEGIIVGQKCDRLQFLQATMGSEGNGCAVARYRIRYADGEVVMIPVILGQNAAEWVSPAAITNDMTPTLGVYKFAWENPRPGVEVSAVDLNSTLSLAAPFVIAITAESGDTPARSTPPPTDAALLRDKKFAELASIVRHRIESGGAGSETLRVTWTKLGLLMLLSGDLPAYRKVCNEMHARFKVTGNVFEAESTAKTCLLAPNSGVSDSDIGLLLETMRAGESDASFRPWLALVRGLADYRAGRWPEAAENLSSVSGSPQAEAAAAAVLAMARARQDAPKEAARCLAVARSRIAPHWPAEAGNAKWWHDWLIAHLLLQEAGQLIGAAE